MTKTKGKTLVRRHDYDFYTVRLPFSMIRKRERSLFVRRELEKRHPRFSEKCCTDTKWALRKGKLTAEVAVMDRVRLAQYKKSFPGKRLFLELQPERAVFKKSRTGGTVLMCALLGCAVLLGVRTIRHLRPAQDNVSVAAQPEPTERASMLAPEQLLVSILAAVTRKGGRLTAARWQGNQCSFAITGCHPEDVVSGERCTVSYQNGEPHFEVALRAQEQTPVAHENASPAAELVPALRHALLSYGAVILSEQIADDSVTVQLFAAHNVLGRALKVCAEQAELHGWCEASFALQSGENGCDAKITLAAGNVPYEIQSPLQTLAIYAPLFIPSEPPAAVRPRRANVVHAPVVEREKVGEIRRMDGSAFVYYRMGDGRIVCETEKIGG